MQVGDLVQCGDETGIIIEVDPSYTEMNGAEACDWINVMWSGIEGSDRYPVEIEGISRSDVDYWLREGVWTKPESG